MTRKFNDLLLWVYNTVFKQNTIERWTKGCILSFSKKGDLGITKNYRSINLAFIIAQVNNALVCNCIEPEIEKVLRKNQNGFQRKQSTTSQILNICQIIEGVYAKNLEATLILSSSLTDYPFNKALCHICFLTKATSWKHTCM